MSTSRWLLTGVLAVACGAARAETWHWDGGGSSATADGRWSWINPIANNNWVENTIPPGSNIIGYGTNTTEIVFDATMGNWPATTLGFGGGGLTLRSLTFTGAADTDMSIRLTQGTSTTVASSLFFDTDAVGGSGAITVQANSTANIEIGVSGNGNVVLRDNLEINHSGDGTLTINRPITGTGYSVTKSGIGTLLLSGANTYSGGTVLSNGMMVANSNGALGTGELTMAGGSLSNSVSSTLANTVNLSVASIIGVTSAKTLTLSGTVTNAGALTKGGAGTLVLSGSNTYSGATLVSEGTLKLGHTSALGSATGTADGMTIASGATLDLGGVANGAGTERITVSGAGVGGAGALLSSAQIATPFIGVRYLTLAGDTTLGFPSRWDVGRNAAGDALVGGGYNLTLTGSANASFNGLGNTDLGDITVNTGKILYLQTSTTLGRPAYTLTLGGGSALWFWGTSSVLSYDKKIAMDTASLVFERAATLSGTINLTGGNSMSVQGAGVTGILSGVISGGGSLIKKSTGTLVLSATNSFTGGTAVSAGNLRLGTSDALYDNGQVTLSGGTLELNGVTDTVGALEVTATSTLALGSGTGRLTFSGDSTALPWTETGNLLLTGTLGKVGPTCIRFTHPNRLTAAQRKRILINGHFVVLDGDGYLVEGKDATVLTLK